MKPTKTIHKKLLHDETGEASYISAAIYILIMVLLIAFILNVFSIISAKQKMDHAVDQLVKQIQLNGGINADTDYLFNTLKQSISASNLTYTVDCTVSADKIQIGTPFYVTLQGDCALGGFYKFDLVKINLKANGAGVSERYWK